MNRTQRILDWSVSLLFLLATFLYFSVCYGFHTVNLEQLQLFECTKSYFAETVRVPGGFSDYLGRFLTQFCYHAWSGALVIALLLLLVRLLLRALCRRKDALVSALTFIPSILMMMVMCYRFPTISLLTAFVLALAAALAVTRITRPGLRRGLALVLVPVLYWLLGSFALLFALILAVREHNRPFAAAAVVLAVACPLVAWPFLPYPLGRLLYGLCYYKVHNALPVWPWIAVLAAAAIVALAETGLAGGKQRAWPAFYGLVVAAAIPAVLLSSSRADEQSLEYNILTGKRAWNRILTEAMRKAPRTYSETACLNLALCKTGHLGGHMFDYLQDGPETLLPGENTPHQDGLSTAEIYYQVGMVNIARRHCYEALGVTPDYQNSAPVFKLLAETSIVNGRYSLARQYLKALSHTLYYKKWADDLLARFEDGGDPALLEEYAVKRLERYKGPDYIFDYNRAGITLSQLLQESPANMTALSYLLAWYLLNKDLDGFVAACPFEGYTTTVPKAWQEAFLLYWQRSGAADEELPDFIDKGLAAGLAAFTRDFNANVPMEQLKQRYGNSYWFYYYFKK